MKRAGFADVPKFKTIERKLRQMISDQKALATLLASANGNKHERKCLDAALEECDTATMHIRQAQQRLYDAFDPPGADGSKSAGLFES